MKPRPVRPARTSRTPGTRAQRTPRSARGRRTRRLLLYSAVALTITLAAAAFLAPGLWQSSALPNVLLVTLDTVRADRIGAYGYQLARTPNLDRLAREGIRFADVSAPAPITGPSHAALFTGLYPGRLGVRDNVTTPLPDEALTLAEILAGRGYRTGGFVGAFLLDRPYGFAAGFQTFESGFVQVESGREANAERRGDAVVDDALRWLQSVPSDQPFFAWVHLYDAHAAYEPPQPLATEFAGRLYDGEIAFVDHQVGRLLQALEARGALSRTHVIVIGDHGEALGEHGEDEHGVFLYEEVMRIPWVMRGPDSRKGLVVSEQVRAVDLFPTVLALLGIDAPPGLDGESVVAAIEGDLRSSRPAAYAETYYPKLHYGWSELRSLRADNWKLIDAPRPELYDLKNDPRELHNLYDQQRALADRMLAEASRIWREIGGDRPTAFKSPDAGTLQRLRSLGYVGATAATADGDSRGADPKDKLADRREFNRLISEAIDDMRARRLEAAAGKFRRLIQLNDRAYDLHQMLGETYQKLGKLVEALGEFEMAGLLNPHAAAPRLSAAEIHLARGEPGPARALVDEATRIEPRSFDVAMVTGRVLEHEGRLPQALAAYEEAVRLNPANSRPRMLIVSLATQMKEFDRAEQQLRQLLQIGYQPSRTHLALGRVAQMRGRDDEAARYYREALRLEPGLRMAEEGLRSLGRE